VPTGLFAKASSSRELSGTTRNVNQGHGSMAPWVRSMRTSPQRIARDHSVVPGEVGARVFLQEVDGVADVAGGDRFLAGPAAIGAEAKREVNAAVVGETLGEDGADAALAVGVGRDGD